MSKPDDEEDLFENVRNLRARLRKTERNLQTITKLERGYNGKPSDASTPDSRAAPLRLSDLDDLDSEHNSNKDIITFQQPKRPPRKHAKNGAKHSADVTPKSLKDVHSHNNQNANSNLQCYYFINESSSGGDQLKETLKRKLHENQEENSRLIAQNRQLISELENATMHAQKSSFKINQMSEDIKAREQESNCLKERLKATEADLEARENMLRESEDRLEESQNNFDEAETQIRQNEEELMAIRSELSYESTLRERVEEERDSAIAAIEELQDALEDYQLKAKEKIKRHQNSEEHLKESLKHADLERGNLLEENKALQEQINDQRQQIEQLVEDKSQAMGTKNSLEEANRELRAQVLTHAQAISDQEHELESASQLQSENERLLQTVQEQQHHLELCQEEISLSQEQLAKLEEMANRLQRERDIGSKASIDSGIGYSKARSLSPLSVPKEDLDGSYLGTLPDSSSKPQNVAAEAEPASATIAKLRQKLAERDARIAALEQRTPPASPSQTGDHLRQELAQALQQKKHAEDNSTSLQCLIDQMKKDCQEQASRALTLEEQIAEMEVQTSSLEAELGQHQDQLKYFQQQLKERDELLIKLDHQEREKSSKVSSLESELEAKTLEQEDCMSRFTSLEEQTTSTLEKLHKVTEQLEEKRKTQQQNEAMIDRMKQLHSEQCQEMERQIELLQQKFERKCQQLNDTEKELHKALDEAEIHSLALSESKKEVELHALQTEYHMQNMNHKVTEATEQIREQEGALALCRSELRHHQDQLESVREENMRELRHKKETLNSLEDQIKKLNELSDEKDTQVDQLESALEERQIMLQKSNDRITELEEAQSILESQVSHLEHEIQHQKGSNQHELSELERKLNQACSEVERRVKQVQEMTNTIRNLASDKSKLSDDIDVLERRLQKEQQNVESEEEKVALLEDKLHEVNLALNQRMDQVEEVDEMVRSMEYDLQENQEKISSMETELKKTKDELRECRHRIQELEDDLDHSKRGEKQKQEQLDNVKHQLRCSQDELRSRNREIEDLEQSLKQRQWELQQRAAQVTQMDVQIKEEKSSLSQRVIQLEADLKKITVESHKKSQKLEATEKKLNIKKSELEEKQEELEAMEGHIKTMQNELETRFTAMSNLQKVVEGIKNQFLEIQNENDSLNRELRESREKYKSCDHELQESRHELSMNHRECQRLRNEAHEMQTACQRMDKEATDLAEKLGTMKAREKELEKKLQIEKAKVLDSVKNCKEHFENELSGLRIQSQVDLDEQSEEIEVYRKRISVLEDDLSELKRQLQMAQSEVQGVTAELETTREMFRSSNESIVVKEAQIARLEARISSYERAASLSSITHSISAMQDSRKELEQHTAPHASSYGSSQHENGSYELNHLDSKIISVGQTLLKRPGISVNQSTPVKQKLHFSNMESIDSTASFDIDVDKCTERENSIIKLGSESSEEFKTNELDAGNKHGSNLQRFEPSLNLSEDSSGKGASKLSQQNFEDALCFSPLSNQNDSCSDDEQTLSEMYNEVLVISNDDVPQDSPASYELPSSTLLPSHAESPRLENEVSSDHTNSKLPESKKAKNQHKQLNAVAKRSMERLYTKPMAPKEATKKEQGSKVKQHLFTKSNKPVAIRGRGNKVQNSKPRVSLSPESQFTTSTTVESQYGLMFGDHHSQVDNLLTQIKTQKDEQFKGAESIHALGQQLLQQVKMSHDSASS